MTTTKEINKSVSEFVDRAALEYAKYARHQFAFETFAEVFYDALGEEMNSPIEQLFYVALKAQVLASGTNFNPSPIYIEDRGWGPDAGIHVHPQKKIGKYRVDFFVEPIRIGPEDDVKPIVVELDGHEFHDRDARQRSYEKQRDRFFMREGYLVAHFTGSDVVKDPFKCAFEVLEMFGAMLVVPPYDPAHPISVVD